MGKEQTEFLFAQQPVKRAVIRQVTPAVFSQMIALIYNIADTYFVGQLNNPKAAAALTVSASSFLMLTALSNLFGVGGASLLARLLGQKQPEEAKRVSAPAFWFGFASACLFSGIYLLIQDPVLTLCGASASVLPIARCYVRWTVILGGPFVVGSTLLANLIRAEGKALKAATGLSLGGVLNIILDPVFVLPQFMGLGAEGAGMATAISNAVSLVYFLAVIFAEKRQSVVSLSPKYLPSSSRYLGKLLSIGLPSALQYALTVVAVAAQSSFVSKYSAHASAALGIGKKLDNLPLYFSIGVANGLLPMLAYNHAAQNEVRKKEVFRFGCILAVGFSITCLVLYEVFAPQLAGIFIDDAETIAYATAFLRRMVIAMPLMAFAYLMIVQFQAMGRARESLVISVIRKGVIDIPLLYIMDKISPLYGCLWVQPIVDSLALVISIMLYRNLENKTDR